LAPLPSRVLLRPLCCSWFPQPHRGRSLAVFPNTSFL
jgi:hypothetical protein